MFGFLGLPPIANWILGGIAVKGAVDMAQKMIVQQQPQGHYPVLPSPNVAPAPPGYSTGIGYSRGARPPVTVEDVASVTTIDHRGARVFQNEIKREIWRTLSGQWARPAPDAGLYDDIITMAPDPKGDLVPLERSAEAWALDQNDRRVILAPIYIPFNTSARRFLRAVPSHKIASLAAPNSMYAVLAEIGEGRGFSLRNAVGVEQPPTPPEILTPVPMPEPEPFTSQVKVEGDVPGTSSTVTTPVVAPEPERPKRKRAKKKKPANDNE